MPRFQQTILPLSNMITVFWKLSWLFAIATVVQNYLDPEPNPIDNLPSDYNYTQMRREWENNAQCYTHVPSFVYKYPDVMYCAATIFVIWLLGAIKAITYVILPYYTSTTVISMWA